MFGHVTIDGGRDENHRFDLVGKARGRCVTNLLGDAYRNRSQVCYPIFRMVTGISKR